MQAYGDYKFDVGEMTICSQRARMAIRRLLSLVHPSRRTQ